MMHLLLFLVVGLVAADKGGAPAHSYGAPPEPAPAYGAPAEPASSYGAPAEPAPSYGAPAEPAPSYGAPESIEHSYEEPVKGYAVKAIPAYIVPVPPVPHPYEHYGKLHKSAVKGGYYGYTDTDYGYGGGKKKGHKKGHGGAYGGYDSGYGGGLYTKKGGKYYFNDYLRSRFGYLRYTKDYLYHKLLDFKARMTRAKGHFAKQLGDKLLDISYAKGGSLKKGYYYDEDYYYEPHHHHGKPDKGYAPAKGKGKGKGGDYIIEEEYGAPEKAKAPKGGYGPPPEEPKGGYGAPEKAKAPKGGYGPPPKAPKGGYGPPPKAPKGGYAAPEKAKAPKGGYGPPPKAPKGGYGPPPKAPKGGYGPPPKASKGHTLNYGPSKEQTSSFQVIYEEHTPPPLSQYRAELPPPVQYSGDSGSVESYGDDDDFGPPKSTDVHLDADEGFGYSFDPHTFDSDSFEGGSSYGAPAPVEVVDQKEPIVPATTTSYTDSPTRQGVPHGGYDGKDTLPIQGPSILLTLSETPNERSPSFYSSSTSLYDLPTTGYNNGVSNFDYGQPKGTDIVFSGGKVSDSTPLTYSSGSLESADGQQLKNTGYIPVNQYSNNKDNEIPLNAFIDVSTLFPGGIDHSKFSSSVENHQIASSHHNSNNDFSSYSHIQSPDSTSFKSGRESIEVPVSLKLVPAKIILPQSQITGHNTFSNGNQVALYRDAVRKKEHSSRRPSELYGVPGSSLANQLKSSFKQFPAHSAESSSNQIFKNSHMSVDSVEYNLGSPMSLGSNIGKPSSFGNVENNSNSFHRIPVQSLLNNKVNSSYSHLPLQSSVTVRNHFDRFPPYQNEISLEDFREPPLITDKGSFNEISDQIDQFTAPKVSTLVSKRPVTGLPKMVSDFINKPISLIPKQNNMFAQQNAIDGSFSKPKESSLHMSMNAEKAADAGSKKTADAGSKKTTDVGPNSHGPARPYSIYNDDQLADLRSKSAAFRTNNNAFNLINVNSLENNFGNDKLVIDFPSTDNKAVTFNPSMGQLVVVSPKGDSEEGKRTKSRQDYQRSLTWSTYSSYDHTRESSEEGNGGKNFGFRNSFIQMKPPREPTNSKYGGIIELNNNQFRISNTGNRENSKNIPFATSFSGNGNKFESGSRNNPQNFFTDGSEQRITPDNIRKFFANRFKDKSRPSASTGAKNNFENIVNHRRPIQSNQFRTLTSSSLESRENPNDVVGTRNNFRNFVVSHGSPVETENFRTHLSSCSNCRENPNINIGTKNNFRNFVSPRKPFQTNKFESFTSSSLESQETPSSVIGTTNNFRNSLGNNFRNFRNSQNFRNPRFQRNMKEGNGRITMSDILFNQSPKMVIRANNDWIVTDQNTPFMRIIDDISLENNSQDSSRKNQREQNFRRLNFNKKKHSFLNFNRINNNKASNRESSRSIEENDQTKFIQQILLGENLRKYKNEDILRALGKDIASMNENLTSGNEIRKNESTTLDKVIKVVKAPNMVNDSDNSEIRLGVDLEKRSSKENNEHLFNEDSIRTLISFVNDHTGITDSSLKSGNSVKSRTANTFRNDVLGSVATILTNNDHLNHRKGSAIDNITVTKVEPVLIEAVGASDSNESKEDVDEVDDQSDFDNVIGNVTLTFEAKIDK